MDPCFLVPVNWVLLFTNVQRQQLLLANSEAGSTVTVLPLGSIAILARPMFKSV